MIRRQLLFLNFVLVLFFGCGKQETLLPTDPLSEQQKAAIVAEDKAIADEESQGKNPAQRKLAQRKG